MDTSDFKDIENIHKEIRSTCFEAVEQYKANIKDNYKVASSYRDKIVRMQSDLNLTLNNTSYECIQIYRDVANALRDMSEIFERRHTTE